MNKRKDPVEVQTRNENGSLQFWPTIDAAFEAAAHDSDIWKISWTNEPTQERVRFVRKSIQGFGGWVYEPIRLPDSKFE